MYKFQLIKGRSYSGVVKVKAEKPFVEVEDEETAKALIATKRFLLVEETDADEIDKDPNSDDDELAKMTAAQLDEYAEENGIDLSGCRLKAEKLARIREADGELNFEENE